MSAADQIKELVAGMDRAKARLLGDRRKIAEYGPAYVVATLLPLIDVLPETERKAFLDELLQQTPPALTLAGFGWSPEKIDDYAEGVSSHGGALGLLTELAEALPETDRLRLLAEVVRRL